MKLKNAFGLCTALLMFVVPVCHAEDVFIGKTISAGPAFNNKKSGEFVDGSVYGGLGLWLIAGAEAKRIAKENLYGGYVGLGLMGLLQAHVGASNHGGIYRIKSEIAPFAMYRSNMAYPWSKTDAASWDRVTVSLTYENTFRDKGLSNVTLGIGYIFN